MKVTFLGTGTSQGVPLIACECRVCTSADERDKRLRSSVLIQEGNTNIIIDSGPDFRQQVLRTGIQHLDALIFTHAHKDHIAGMDDIRGFNFRMKRAIDVYCTDKVEEGIRREFHYIFADAKYPGIPEIQMHRIYNGTGFMVHNIPVQPVQVKHMHMPVLGFRIGKFAYVTDANYIAPEEKEKLLGCDILVLNALRREKHVSHFTLDEALAMVDELKPGRAYFTHISHQLGLHAEVEEELPSHARLAYDGLEVVV